VTANKYDIDALEAAANALFGEGQFNWVIGRTISDGGDHVWFWYAGTEYDAAQRSQWKHRGQSPSIRSAMVDMLEAGES